MKTKFKNNQEDNHDEIRELAFLLWEQAGCPAGKDREFWLKAEEQIVMPHGLSSALEETSPKKTRITKAKAAVQTESKPRKKAAAKTGKSAATR